MPSKSRENAAPPLLLATVTTTDVVATLPAASRASARIVCGPSPTVVEFHVAWYGALVSALPRFTLSILNWTLTTPTLSDADAWIATAAPLTCPPSGVTMLTDGGV